MKVPEQYRIKFRADDYYYSDSSMGANGMFKIPFKNKKLLVIASDGAGWQHVSVSLKHRTPTWEEMCYVKDLFWDEEEVVYQLHPPKSRWINNFKYCLHMWRNPEKDPPLPPDILVGFK